MAIHNISVSADALQAPLTLLDLLQQVDEAAVVSLLSTSERTSPNLPSPFTGWLLRCKYDPFAVLDLVDELWPFRMEPHKGPGRKSEDPLPLVCYLLPLCDPDYGTIENRSEAYRRLKSDETFRHQAGYSSRVPSRSVFNNIAGVLAANWPRFQECVATSEFQERLLDRLRQNVSDPLCGAVQSESPYAAELAALGWKGNVPPLYLPHPPQLVVPSSGAGIVGPADGVCLSGSAGEYYDGANSGLTDEGGLPPERLKRGDPGFWKAYNGAQGLEWCDFRSILGGLADLLNIMELSNYGCAGKGRPRSPLGHAVFACVLKAHEGLIWRELPAHLKDAIDLGYFRAVPSHNPSSQSGIALGTGVPPVKIPHANTLGDVLRSEWVTPILLELVSVTAGPLREIDTIFAIDGTGLSTRQYERWLHVKTANRPQDSDESDTSAEGDADGLYEVRRHQWVKLHILVGVKTNVIVRAAISPGNSHDNIFYPGLVSESAQRFYVKQVCADMAYSSKANCELAEKLGFDAWTPFKSNTRPPSDDNSPWDVKLRYSLEYPEEFWKKYHQRSIVESTISAMKRLLREQLRTKAFNTQVNEALCKVIAYNLSVLVRQARMRRLDVDLPAEAVGLEPYVKGILEMRKSCSASLEHAA